MSSTNVTLYLEPDLLQRAKAGDHNFIGQMVRVLENGGMQPTFAPRLNSAPAPGHETDGYALHHMVAPPHPKALNFRRAYYYPFWRIEAEAERWNWPVAKAEFDPGMVNPDVATRWAAQWRKRLFPEARIERAGFVYVPLQGRLLQHRSFQIGSPLEMLGAVLAAETERPIIATLHPKETYSPDDLAALDELAGSDPRLTIKMGGMEQLLPACDYVVTQNSSVGFAGLFLHKPLVLFGKIDFHHIAAKAADSSGYDAIQKAKAAQAPYDAYLYWFLQLNAINAGRPEAEDQIRQRLLEFGWPLK